MPDPTMPSAMWNTLFRKIGLQGLKDPLSPSDEYFGFLSKADYDEQTHTWDILFEVVPAEWMDKHIWPVKVLGPLPAPMSPASLYHIRSVEGHRIVNVLGLTSTDDIAEGSWYAMKLVKDGEEGVSGDLYNPDIDLHPEAKETVIDDLNHGTYWFVEAIPIAVPDLDKNGNITLGPATPDMVDLAEILWNRFRPFAPTMKIQSKSRGGGLFAAEFAMPVMSVGVMDVGQGNCNMVIDQNHDVAAYYDVGFPLYFFADTAPHTIRPPFPHPGGPIVQNQNGDLAVILSHWDWDHWRLGRMVAGLALLDWIVPIQPVGPATANFCNHQLPSRVLWPNHVPFQWYGVHQFVIMKCRPPNHAPAAMLMNNSGLAVRFNILLPTADPFLHTVILTGDANFNTQPGVAPGPNPATGLTAVHHGSNAHGAAANLPVPPVGYAITGRIAYSYGVRPNGVHPYGFPNAAARGAYEVGGWRVATSTAEGIHINNNPPVAFGHVSTEYRGNIRIGDQAALPAVYNNTAFFHFPNVLN